MVRPGIIGAISLLDSTLWQKCSLCLQDELPTQQFNTWIRPLEVTEAEQQIRLAAPNRFIKDWVADKYLGRIEELLGEFAAKGPI